MKDFTVYESEHGEVMVDGNLTVENAAALRDLFIGALEKSASITLSVGDGARVDLSFFQLLCGFHRLAARNGKKFLRGHFPSELLMEIRNAGCVREASCIPAAGKACIWVAGGGNV